MAFRYSGTAWDGQKWIAAAGIKSLGVDVALYEARPTAQDGTVASKGHDAASPNSDHTVKPKSGAGVVRAIDMSVTFDQGDQISETIRTNRDRRLKYLIWNLRMFSSYVSSSGKPAWEWRPYGGTNGHITHIHVSTLQTGDPNGQPWEGIGAEYMFTDHEIEELKKLVAALDSVNSNGSFAAPAVKLIRRERSKPLHAHASDGHDHDGRYVKNVNVSK